MLVLSAFSVHQHLTRFGISSLRSTPEQGDASAQCGLGDLYYEGEGVPQDYAEAIRLWKLAAEQGDEEAQYNLDNYA